MVDSVLDFGRGLVPWVSFGGLALIGLVWALSKAKGFHRVKAPRRGLPLGKVGFRKAAVSWDALRRHIHVLGPIGTGKTTLLVNWIMFARERRLSCVVVDPVGDMTKDMDAEALIDPTREDSWGFDPLAGNPHLVADAAEAFFAAAFRDVKEKQRLVLRKLILTFVGSGRTMLDFVPMLRDPKFRRAAMAWCPEGEFWRWYDVLSSREQQAYAGPLVTRLDLLLSRPEVARVIGRSGQPNPLKVLERGGRLVVRIPEGTIGEATARFLGTMFLSLLWDWFRAKAKMPEDKRRTVLTILDEAPKFLSANLIGRMLDEGRKWGLALVIAHQHLRQLEAYEASIGQNTLTKIAFRLEADDAARLGGSRRTFEAIGIEGLMRLPPYVAAVRTAVGGAVLPPFVAKLPPPPKAAPQAARDGRKAAAQVKAEMPNAEPNPLAEDDSLVLGAVREGCTSRELAERIEIPYKVAWAALESLRARGLVERSRSEGGKGNRAPYVYRLSPGADRMLRDVARRDEATV